MAPEKLDKIFKNKLEHSSEIPKDIEWNKEDSWNNFNKKSRTRKLRIWSYYSAAVIIIGFMLFYFPNIENIKSINTKTNFKNEFEEYQKRQKLKEIEMRLSGKKVNKNYCMNCEGLLPNKNKLRKNTMIFTN